MSINAESIVSLSHVGISFGTFAVHKDITFSVSSGEGITILGPSGTGKTLILKMIGGLLKPTSGTVSLLGTDLNHLSPDSLQEMRSNVGMLFQGAALFDSLSVYDNVAYSLHEARTYDERQIREIVTKQLRLVGLPGIEEKFPGQLSGGQKKRVGLARALAREPKIMLFDEPTTGLDPTSARLIDDLVLKLRRDLGITTISVTHDIASAHRISERWILIDGGAILADGLATEVAEADPSVKKFISGNWKS